MKYLTKSYIEYSRRTTFIFIVGIVIALLAMASQNFLVAFIACLIIGYGGYRECK